MRRTRNAILHPAVMPTSPAETWSSERRYKERISSEYALRNDGSPRIGPYRAACGSAEVEAREARTES